MRFACLLAILFFVTSCNNQKDNALLSTSELPAQIITIDTKKDTVVKTANGALLAISSGTFSGEEIQLEIKEAYTIEDIIRAGLRTQTDGRPLRSGGMIYISAVDKGSTIRKPIKVSVPSPSYDKYMQLYKGEEKDGSINWTDPLPLNDTLSRYLVKGQKIFAANCAPCHGYDKTLTGPAMKGLESRGPWKDRQELIAFTRNPGGYIPKTCYTKSLTASYNGQIMPGYPSLSDADMNAMYDYIRNEDINNGVDLTNNYRITPCEDSCRLYDSIRYAAKSRIDTLNEQRNLLINGNEDRINYTRMDSTGTTVMNNRNDVGTLDNKVVPEDYKAVYYRFDITSFGWYNIDALLENAAATAGSLVVTVDTTLDSKWDVFIAVPAQKVFDRGGKLSTGTGYGFFTKDGKIPLKAGSRVVVFVLGEADGQIAFAFRDFITTGNDVIRLQPQLATKEEFNLAVKSWGIEKVAIEAGDARNAAAIREADKEIKSQQELAERYRPKTCDCNCGDKVLADSVTYR